MTALSAGMTWRRFQILLAGLGPNSAVVNRFNARQTDRKGKSGAKVITDKREAERAVSDFFGKGVDRHGAKSRRTDSNDDAGPKGV